MAPWFGGNIIELSTDCKLYKTRQFAIWPSNQKRTTAAPLFKEAGILNLKDYITQYNCLYAYDSINGNLPRPLLDDRITFVQTSGNTRDERLNQLVNFRTNTVLYGTRSIKSRAVRAWNEINLDLHDMQLQNCSKSVCKDRVFKYLIDKYPNNAIPNIDNDNNINILNINNDNNNNRNRARNNNNDNYHLGIY